MTDELDLEHGDAERAERISEQGKAARSKRRSSSDSSSGSSSRSSSSKASSGGSDTSVASGLNTAFDRIVEQLESRDDDELAQAIREDKKAMSDGLVALTRTVKVLRMPLIVFLNFLLPILAFWRVGGILARRFVARRQRVMMEREVAMAEQQAAAEAAGLEVVQ